MIIKLLLRNGLLIVFGYVVFITPLLFFGDGFFLRRVEFPNKSTEKGSSTYSRAVILLVDALSFSFVKTDPSISNTDYFSNKLTVFEELLNTSDHAKLYKFIADPPTTTMQRIKALSTGSLSTFVEIAANFFSSEIQEDSWIFQGKSVGKGVIALGDDTWDGLFPNSFKRSYLLPSFNVKDLDTVDNGVIDHLYDELDKRDWSVLLAHFLGVDHCGHTYGRNHPEMSRKLKQMDSIIRKVLDYLDNETVLFVFGDHGMTPNGDHGGDSELEVSSAFFALAPKHSFTDVERGDITSIFQTDFIPTLSLLLGWPIPFSSVGTLIDDLFTHNSVSKADSLALLKAYMANSKQLEIYFDKYFGNGTTAENSKLKEIDDIYSVSLNYSSSALSCLQSNKPSDSQDTCKAEVEKAIASHKALHKLIRASCEAAWVKFNMVLVFGGIFGMGISIVILVCLLVELDSQDENLLPLALGGILLMCVPLGGKALFLFPNDITAISCLLCCLFMIFLFFAWKMASCSLDKPREDTSFISAFFRSISHSTVFSKRNELFVASLCLAPLLLGKFSNSYVIYEPFIVLLLLNIFILIRGHGIISKVLHSLSISSGKLWRYFLSLDSQFTFMCCLITVLRLQLSFLSCREEHGPFCEQISYLTPLGSLVSLPDASGGTYLTVRFLVAAFSLFLVPIYFCQLGKRRGNLVAQNMTWKSLFYSYGIYFIALCVVFDWLLQACSKSHNYDTHHSPTNSRIMTTSVKIPAPLLCLFPRIVYLLSTIVFGSLLVSPLLFTTKSEVDVVTEQLESANGKQAVDPSNPEVMRTLYNFLKTKYNRRQDGSDPNKSHLYVYGLGSVISAAWQMFYACCLLLACMLCGDGLCPAIAGVCIALFLFYKLELSTNTGLSIALAVYLVQLLAFYSTGHQAAWTHIKWQAAFVGFEVVPDCYAIPGALILTNTFAGNVVSVLSVPFFILWPVVEMNCLPSSSSGGKKTEIGFNDDADKAECGFVKRPKVLADPLIRACLLFVLLTAVEAFVSSIAACVLRRHLMAYKIFVPRLIFSIISFIYNFVLLLAVGCIPLYFLKRLEMWRNSVE